MAGLLWSLQPGCAQLDARYDSLRGECELVPTVRLIFDRDGLRLDPTPELRC